MTSLLPEASLKVSLMLLVALAVVWCLRHRSAAARHWVLSVAILCALLLPVLAAVGPTWFLPVDFMPVAATWSVAAGTPTGEAGGGRTALPATSLPATSSDAPAASKAAARRPSTTAAC